MSNSHKKNQVQFRPAPEVIAMAGSSMGRVQKLLGICEIRLNSVEGKATNPDELPTRDIQTLVRMILTLQKEWDKYAAILFPATEVTPLTGSAAGHLTPEKEADLNAGKNEELKTAMLLRENLSALAQDLDALQVAALSSSPATKKQAKAQKFSHAFFQKRPQTAIQ